MRISDWSSDVCSSDLLTDEAGEIFELFCLRVEGALLDDRLSSSSSDHFLRAPGNIAIDHALCASENPRCLPVVRFQARNLTVGPLVFAIEDIGTVGAPPGEDASRNR